MDIRKIKKLIELLDESGVAEIEIHEGEESVRISRHGTAAAGAPPPGYYPPAMPAAPVAAAIETAAPAAEETTTGHEVTAPMVGTYYSASAPGAEPFIKVGQKVNQGDTIGIIEAMKLLNQIEADASGTIKAICVENGDPLEYGQTICIID
jgi:acetyl-CoA carboxylase biotin carboxyl carrier protein